ncbi:hypothetical protein ACFSS8_06900 [Paracoccus kondratievae]
MSFLLAIKWSLGAFAVKLILGFLSMGALGAALYYLCYPILAPFYGNLNNWSGDWVWSATIWAGMLWSVSFLAAGALNLQLEGQGISAPWRGGVYLAVLWGRSRDLGASAGDPVCAGGGVQTDSPNRMRERQSPLCGGWPCRCLRAGTAPDRWASLPQVRVE